MTNIIKANKAKHLKKHIFLDFDKEYKREVAVLDIYKRQPNRDPRVVENQQKKVDKLEGLL